MVDDQGNKLSDSTSQIQHRDTQNLSSFYIFDGNLFHFYLQSLIFHIFGLLQGWVPADARRLIIVAVFTKAQNQQSVGKVGQTALEGNCTKLLLFSGYTYESGVYCMTFYNCLEMCVGQHVTPRLTVGLLTLVWKTEGRSDERSCSGQ